VREGQKEAEKAKEKACHNEVENRRATGSHDGETQDNEVQNLIHSAREKTSRAFTELIEGTERLVRDDALRAEEAAGECGGGVDIDLVD